MGAGSGFDTDRPPYEPGPATRGLSQSVPDRAPAAGRRPQLSLVAGTEWRRPVCCNSRRAGTGSGSVKRPGSP